LTIKLSTVWHKFNTTVTKGSQKYSIFVSVLLLVIESYFELQN